MRLNRIAAACSIALATSLAASPAQANALLDAYQKALSNDKTLQAAEFQRDALLEARPQARAAYLPQIGAQGSITQQDSNSTFSSAQFGAGNSSQTQSTKSTKNAYSVSLTQALFNWEAIQRLRQSTDQIALAETSYRAAQQTLILRVAQAYFNVLAAADNLQFSIAENTAVGRQLEQSKQRFDVGLSAITDVQEAQSRYDLTVAQQIDADTALASAKRVLTTITASDDALTGLREDLPLTGPDPDTPATWIEAARRDNLSVLAARLVADIAKTDIKAVRAKHLPTLSIEAGYSSSDASDTKINGNSAPSTNDGTSVALVARLPIFAGGAVQSGVRAASSTYAQRTAEFENATRTAERQTGDAYQGVLAGISRVKAYKQAVLSTKTALEASEVGLQVGARTSIDVLNAQREVSNAERTYSRARYDYLLAILSLKQSAGRLNEADLAEIDRVLNGS